MTKPVPQLIGALLLTLPLSASLAQASNTDTNEKKAEQKEPSTAKQADTAGTLKPVTVTDSQSRESVGYNSAVSRVGKTTQALRDIPNSVTVVPEQLMHDRNADTFKEALRNVAGLTFNAGEGGRIGDNMTLRGFSVVGDLYLDNMRDIAQYNRETFNLESIDVLRGSASMLYGRGSAGGLINQVTKLPRRYAINEASLTLGNFGYKRLTADINKAWSDTTVGRVNLMLTDTDSFRDEVTQKRWGVAPAITFGQGTDQQFTLAYYHLHEKNLPDYGVPYLNGRPLDVPVTTFYGLANADYEKNNARILTATYQHRFSKDSVLKTALRVGSYDRDVWVVAPRYLSTGTPPVPVSIDTPNNINRGRPARGGEERPIISVTDWTFNAQLGGMKHEMLVGLELATEKSERWSNGNGVLVNQAVATQIANTPTNALSPDARPLLPAGYDNRFRYNPNRFTSDTAALYFQDTIHLTKQWKLVAGLRWDNFKSDYERTITTAGPTQGTLENLQRTDREASKKVGVLFQPNITSSYYASWGTSFNPSGELYQLDPRGVNTPPELNRNIEAGAKWDLVDGDLALRTAIYRTEKTNERNTDVTNANVYLLSGKRHTDGIEVEAAGRITPKWEVFASAALQRGRIDESINATDIGKVPTNTPRYTSSLWTTYQATERLKFGGGVEHIALRYASNSNVNALPSYHRIDAMAEYKFKQHALQFNVKNLTDRKYYEGVYAGHSVPGTTRAVQVSWNVKF